MRFQGLTPEWLPRWPCGRRTHRSRIVTVSPHAEDSGQNMRPAGCPNHRLITTGRNRLDVEGIVSFFKLANNSFSGKLF